jgi:negative regulator of flagellin synthesis FlgM
MDMNINGLPRVQGAYRISSFENRSTGRMDRARETKEILTLSDQARDFRTVLDAVSKLPDIREDKVADIQNRIKNGEYNISASAIANKILSA